MDESLFTVYFEDPYWVGIVERTVDGQYSVARIVFGSEPSDPQILEYLSKHYALLRFTPACEVPEQLRQYQRINPKRRQREAANLLKKKGSSTKAQEAMQQSYENLKQEKTTEKRLRKDQAEELKYLKKNEKRKQKKRGR